MFLRALALLLLGLAGCGGPTTPPGGPPPSAAPPNANTRVLVDDTGYRIELHGDLRRIVSLAPSLTEIIAAVGAESALVGVTMHCDYPESVLALPKVGSYVLPNIEAIVALNPDLVLVVQEGPPRESVEKMRELGIPVAVLRTARIADIEKNIRWIGHAAGVDSEAERVAVDIEHRYRAITQIVAPLSHPRVLYAIAIDPVITAGRGSFLHELIRDAGGENIAGDLEASYPRLTLETIIARKPEAILFSSGMGNEANAPAQRLYWNRWGEIPAVRNKRLLEIDIAIINRPSPRVIQGLAQLAILLHPEKKSEIDRILIP